MKITLSKAQWQTIGKKAGWMRTAGEDWVITDRIKALVEDVVEEIEMRGGFATVVNENIIEADQFVLDPTHVVPIKIKLYEGTYHPEGVVVNASFGEGMGIPVKGYPPFNAKVIVDGVVEGFLELVNFNKNRK